MDPMSSARIREKLFEIACDFLSKGPGYAQEGVVLRKAKQVFNPVNLDEEQKILDAWQKLFRDGDLAWGYDLDNPTAPFFHAPTARVPSTA